MARFTVLFDRDAHADLPEIRDFIAKARGAEFADGFIERIIAYCESLATLPTAARVETRPCRVCAPWAGAKP